MSNCAWKESEHCSKTDSFMSLLNPPGIHSQLSASSTDDSLPSGHSFSPADCYRHNKLGTLGHPGECMVEISQSPSTGSSAVSSSNPRNSVEIKSPSRPTGPDDSVLKEHDYIGLAEVSSSLVPKQQIVAGNPRSANLISILEETDLQLALGPPDRVRSVTTDSRLFHPASKVAKGVSSSQIQNDGNYSSTWLRDSNSEAFHSTKTILNQGGEASIPSGRELDAHNRSEMVAKYGLKRGFSEAMSDSRFSSGGPRMGIFDDSIDFPPAVKTTGGASIGVKNALDHSLHCGWSALKTAGMRSRQRGIEQAGRSSGACSSLQLRIPGMVSQETEVAGLHDDHQVLQADAPPQKEQVIGWPPIRSFRKTTLAAHPKSPADGEGFGNPVDGPAGASGNLQGLQASLYVKVNMDGVPIGRKVDLKAYNSYKELSSALKDMFQLQNNGRGGTHIVFTGPNGGHDELKPFHFHNDVSLTYEDKEGDWMLVGDVPWSMFINTVSRLRIMRDSDGTSIVPRPFERSQCKR